MKKKSKLLVVILESISLIIIAILVSKYTYAYFTADISGSETDVTLTVGAGKIEIDFDGGPEIIATGLKPKNTPVVTKNFTVKGSNTTDLNAEMIYNLVLVIDSITFGSESIGYKLVGTNTSSNGRSIPNVTEIRMIETGLNEYHLGVGEFSGTKISNKTHAYSLEIYFPETGEKQNADQGKKFEMHIETRGETTLETEASSTGTLLAATHSGMYEAGETIKGIKSVTVDNGVIKNISFAGNKITYELESGTPRAGENAETCSGAANVVNATQGACLARTCPNGGTLNGTTCSGQITTTMWCPAQSVYTCVNTSGCGFSCGGTAMACPYGLGLSSNPAPTGTVIDSGSGCTWGNNGQGLCGMSVTFAPGAVATCSGSGSYTATCSSYSYSCPGGGTLSGNKCYSCAQGTLSGTTCTWSCPESYTYYTYNVSFEYYV